MYLLLMGIVQILLESTLHFPVSEERYLSPSVTLLVPFPEHKCLQGFVGQLRKRLGEKNKVRAKYSMGYCTSFLPEFSMEHQVLVGSKQPCLRLQDI